MPLMTKPILKPLPLKELIRPEYRDELPESPDPSIPSILEEALEITSGDRRRDYDHAKPNHERIALYWNAHLEARGIEGKLTATDVVILLILLKVARQARTPKRDNWVDIAGYARCGSQCEEMEP